nr:hypothetical protein CFP56_73419 [Quercus suber]
MAFLICRLTRELFRGSASQEQNHIHVLVFMRILNCCGSRSSGNQYYARGSLMTFLCSIYSLEASRPFATT